MHSTTRAPARAARSTERSGFLYGLSAYIVWGAFPAYLMVLRPASPLEIVAMRIVFTLLFCSILLTVLRQWPALVSIVRKPRLILTMGIAAALIFTNWVGVIYGSLTGHITEVALGYLMNPIITVIVGVVFLRERLRPLQWIAIGITTVAVVTLSINYGSFPWISLLVATTFALYAMVKRKVGGSVEAVSGLAIESIWLVPASIVLIVVLGAGGALTIGTEGVGHTLAIVSTGIVTAIPLLLFAAAARRIPLVGLGFIQYLSPLITLLFGVFVMGEAMPAVRWIGFGIVSVAVVILTIDLIRNSRAGRRTVPELV